MGKHLEITDANNVRTAFVRDLAGRRVISGTAAGLTTEAEYDAAGNLTLLNLPGGICVAYTYTGSGLLRKTEDNTGNYILFFYDSGGNRIREEIHDSSGGLTKYTDFESDDFSNPKRIIYPDGTGEDAEYDGSGSPVRTADAGGKSVLYAYDSLKRLIRITQPGDVITGFGYDSSDNPVSVTDAENRITSYTYDDMGRQTATVSPDTGTTFYFYDSAGNPVSKTDAKGNTITYEYDALNRIIKILYSGHDVLFSYDEGANGRGRLTGIRDLSGSYAYAYDIFGRLVSEKKTVRGIAYLTGYAYDDSGILTEITYPSGRKVTYEPDSTGRITEVRTEKEGVPQILAENTAYLPFGPLTHLNMGNGITLAQAFDGRYRLTGMVSGDIRNLAYVYDPAGNITEIADSLNPLKTRSFVYDDLYRLAAAEGIYGSVSYAYDRTGNRLSRTGNGLTRTYAYGPGTGGLAEIAGPEESRIFSYDAAGNITGINSRSFVYDQNSRLIRAAENGTVSGEYVYNAFGQRAVKTAGGETTVFLYGSEGNLIAESDEKGRIVSEYIWFNGQLLASFKTGTVTEAAVDIDPDTLNLSSKGMMTCFIGLSEGYDASDIIQDSVTMNGTVCAEKAVVSDYDNDGIPDLTVKFDREQVCALPEPGDAVEITVSGSAGDVRFTGKDTVRVIGRKNGNKKTVIPSCYEARNTDRVYFYHLNHLGTPQAMTDEEGNIVWQADYKPFGEAAVTAGYVKNNFRFPGHYFDTETGCIITGTGIMTRVREGI